MLFAGIASARAAGYDYDPEVVRLPNAPDLKRHSTGLVEREVKKDPAPIVAG